MTLLQGIQGLQPVKSEEDHQSKKRKLEHRPNGSESWDKGAYRTFKDVSFSIPQRKKLSLELGLSPKQGVRATSGNGDTEFGVSWADVRDVVCLPVPEKAQAQYNFCIFSTCKDGTAPDQIVWTVPDNVPKDGTFVAETTVQPGDTYRTLAVLTINDALRSFKRQVVEPTREEFSSQIVQAHRKGEAAFHVKAFRGSKDGFLFLLSNGIFWGFKKPLEFFAFDSIDSVSYTSILQRTFNLNVTIRISSESTDTQEFEFSMIDQADFAGIDNYVRRHELQDASMAEQRRAKKLNVNGTKGQATEQEGGDQEEGELEKANREAEDLEDEEEEDENFDPGSEGESEGSGSSSDDDDEGESAVGTEGNIVDYELGSEAESAVD